MPALANDMYISRNKPIVVYKKRIEELFFKNDYPSVNIYATGAAINQAIRLYIFAKKWMNISKESKIITYSVPACYTKRVLNQAPVNPIEETCKWLGFLNLSI